MQTLDWFQISPICDLFSLSEVVSEPVSFVVELLPSLSSRGHTKSTLLDSPWLYWTLLDSTGLYWTLLDSTGHYWTLLDSTVLYRILLDSTGLYWLDQYAESTKNVTFVVLDALHRDRSIVRACPRVSSLKWMVASNHGDRRRRFRW